ncbi:hypothetical protein F4777DRAFT_563092 [Nemania sp. FL0916]|nr:hypothetical protein F4777DRAFT_563092 [Nemania sp. FL0916]
MELTASWVRYLAFHWLGSCCVICISPLKQWAVTFTLIELRTSSCLPLSSTIPFQILLCGSHNRIAGTDGVGAYTIEVEAMESPTRDSYRHASRSDRKRRHDSEHADERRVRRRSDEHGRAEYDRVNVRRQTTHSRSRSPTRRHHHHNSRRHNDDAPTSHRHPHHHHHKPRPSIATPPHPDLPCNARPLSRSDDLPAFRPLFARYLDVQKQIDITVLDEREVRGRWKSFVGKWNSGELAEGWYRPEMFEDVVLDWRAVGKGEGRNAPDEQRRSPSPRPVRSMRRHEHEINDPDERAQNAEKESNGVVTDKDIEDDDDDYGPMLPTQDGTNHSTNQPLSQQTKHGPGIPNLSDLTLRRELEATDRDDARALLRQERKADRALQKERLEELAPRADPGTAARRLEKRREVRESNAAFANAKAADEGHELADSDIFGGGGEGGGEGGVEEYKRMKREAERRKTEREVRREEVLRAKREEREERMKEYREREGRTVDMLREIARSRFG